MSFLHVNSLIIASHTLNKETENHLNTWKFATYKVCPNLFQKHVPSQIQKENLI